MWLPPETLFWSLQAQSIAVEAQANAGLSERIATLEQEVARYKEDAGKAQAEVDRLLEILREMENEKNDKDRKISELERYKTTRLFLMNKYHRLQSFLCSYYNLNIIYFIYE